MTQFMLWLHLFLTKHLDMKKTFPRIHKAAFYLILIPFIDYHVNVAMVLYTDVVIEAWRKGAEKDSRDSEKDMNGDTWLVRFM
jgi:hypothetical protein